MDVHPGLPLCGDGWSATINIAEMALMDNLLAVHIFAREDHGAALVDFYAEDEFYAPTQTQTRGVEHMGLRQVTGKWAAGGPAC
jgi:hypothetical protein